MTDPTKQFECKVCNKAFKKPSILKIHEVVHTGEKPFECDVCGMKFSVKGSLTRHRLIHENSKPFECLICGKTDRRKYRLKNHIQDHHNLTGDRLEAAIQSSERRPAGIRVSVQNKSERRRNIRKSARSEVSRDTRAVSTPKVKRKRLNTAPKRSQQEEEDSERMSDENDSENSSGTSPEQQREIDSESVVASNRETENDGFSDEVNDQIESNEEIPDKKSRLMLALLPKGSKINNPLIESTPFPIKIENPIVQEVGDLMPFLDLSTSSFPPSVSQQSVFDMDSSIEPMVSIPEVPTEESLFECLTCGSKCGRNSRKPKSNHNTPRNFGRNVRELARAVTDESRADSTQKTMKKQSKTARKRSRLEEEDLGVMSDDYDSENGNIDQFQPNEDKTEENPRLILAPLPKRRKIDTPLIKSTLLFIKTEETVPIVQEVGDLMPHMDLLTSSFPPLASQQQTIYDMDLDSEIGSVSNRSSISTPQFSFDEDIRQIAHQLSRVATARPNDHDALREVMFGTILAFGSGGFNGNVGEFYKIMNDRYNH